MYNTFVVDKKQREKTEAEEKERKFQQDRAKLRSRNETYYDQYEKRVDKVLEHIIDHPLPQVNSWVLNETYFVEKTKQGYKEESSKHLAHHCFRMTYNSSQKQRVEENINKNKFLLTEYTHTKPHEFRSRNPELDVNPPMTYTKDKKRSASAGHQKEASQSRTNSTVSTRYPRIKASKEKKGVTFFEDPSSNPITDLRTESLSRIASQESSVAQVINLPNYDKSPYKTLQQYSMNHKSYLLEKDKQLFDKMLNEIYYPSDKSKLPKRMYKQSKEKDQFPFTYSIDSDNGFIDYDVDDDIESLDDPMLYGSNPPKKPKILDRNVLERKILHNKLRSLAAQNALVQSKAVKQHTSFVM